MSRRPHYDTDKEAFPAEAYSVKGYEGIAWYVFGWETEPTEDTEWDGIEQRTGKVVCVMVGDDRRFLFDEDELTALGDLDYCAECGQIGCTHDSRDRSGY